MIGTVRIFREEIAAVRPCYHGVFSTMETWLIDVINVIKTAPGLGTTPTILSHAEAGILSPEVNALRAALVVKWCRP